MAKEINYHPRFCMYISKIRIQGFRNYTDSIFNFNEGLNVIIGHNNCGKTNLIKALSLVFEQSSRRLDSDDFNRNTTLSLLKSFPPKVSIEVTINQSTDEALYSDDLATVGKWVTKLDDPYEALLTYEFFLPDKSVDSYLEAVKLATETQQIWNILRQDFVRLYVHRIYGGDPTLKSAASSEDLQKFDFQFLDAIRDVERDLFTGKNVLLREILDFFMDYDIKSLPESTKQKDIKETEIKQKKTDFSTRADELIKELQERMKDGKSHILSYANATGASFNNASLNFEGSISDVDLYSALKLIVEYETGLKIKIPATHNGLGYNNLIYMSLLLAKMQVNSDGNYLGSNAKVFPMLAIEEPEAHLHPSMQYKFLKFLRENKDIKKKVRQLFVVSHSTHITSAVSLDEIICVHNENHQISVGYAGKCFQDIEAEQKSKAYVQRFLDATKSDMLFAQRVIFVEGIAEQLLLSILAKFSGKSLEDHHVAVINVGGRYFENFLYLFDTTKANSLPKKIACLTDRDPERKRKTEDKYKKCYPYEYDLLTAEYEFKDHATDLVLRYSTHPNIRFFSQDEIKGKTFEYELILFNPSMENLVTDSCSNKKEIKDLMTAFRNGKSLLDMHAILKDTEENRRIISGTSSQTSWDDIDLKSSLIASRYLNSVGKGENALELSYILEREFSKALPTSFVVPTYIQQAIDWVCS